jgi:hypothetical protein
MQMSLKDRWGLGLSGLRVEGYLLPAEEVVKLDVGQRRGVEVLGKLGPGSRQRV